MLLIPKGSCVGAPSARGEPFDSPLMVSLSNHERLAQDVLVEPRAARSRLSNPRARRRPSAFAEATADRRSAKRGGWSTSSGRAVAVVRTFSCCLLVCGGSLPSRSVTTTLACDESGGTDG